MSSLADFVSQQRSAAASNKPIGSYFNVTELGSKVNKFFHSATTGSGSSVDDLEGLIVADGSTNGQLPSSRNRKSGNTNNGWFGNLSFSSLSLSSISSSTIGPVATTPTAEENFCGLSRFQRLAAFFLCIGAAGFCFTTALMLIPVLIIQTRRFATLNTIGSVFFIMSFGFLLGPRPYIGFLLSPPRRLVTITYFATVLVSLYCSIWLQSTVLTMVSASFQACALLWYLLAYVPGGETGLRFMVRLCTTAVLGGKKSSTLVLPI